MAKCKYGDAESTEEVPCQFDTQTGLFACPQPYKRPGAPQKLSQLKMDVKFVDQDGLESRVTVVAKHEDEMESDRESLLAGSGTTTTSRTTREERRGRRNNKLLLKPLSITLADVVGELVGTFLLTLPIITAVASSVVTGALVGLWQVAIASGLGVALSIYCTAYVSEAHLNPAVTLAFAIVRWRVFSWQRILPYVLAQLLGAFCAGGVLFGLYRHAIYEFESEHGIVRGQNGSEISAMLFGEYFPNPSIYSHSVTENLLVVSPVEAVLIEGWATAILVFVIFSLTDIQNTSVGSGTHKVAFPILIGATVAVLISIYAPLTQAGLNPARDFGPRAVAAIAGWGEIAIPGPRNGFWVYIIGPVCGGPIGGALYDCLVAKAVKFAAKMRDKERNPS